MREGGLEPPPTIRGLAPQASASAYSATRAGDDFRSVELFISTLRLESSE